MPTEYFCTECHLGFETGWFHYHQESDNAMAATFLACTLCGTAYMLDHKYDGSPDQLYAWGGPVTWVPTEHEGIYRHAAGTPEMVPVATNHIFRPMRKNAEMARLEGILDELNLSDFACLSCRAKGTLVKRWPEDATMCPRCGKDSLKMAGCYIT